MKKTTILETRDFSRFRSDDHNRSTSKVAIKRIILSMEKYGWLGAYPMHTVPRNGKLYIIDGQHRFKAAEKLGIPVLYVVCEDIDGFHVSDVNVAQSAWTIRDFATSYANQGKPAYVKLLHYCLRYDIPIGCAAKLLQNNLGDGVTCTKALKTGQLNIASGDLAEIVGTLIEALREQGVAFARNSSFIDALMRVCLVESFCKQTFLDRVRSNPGKLTLEPTSQRFLESIEAVYNHRATKSKTLPLKFLAMQVSRK